MATPHPAIITDWLADMPSDTEQAPWMVRPDYQFGAPHPRRAEDERQRAEKAEARGAMLAQLHAEHPEI